MTVIPSFKVEIAFDAGYSTPAASRTWTDVTNYVGPGGYDIQFGRRDEFSGADPNTLTLTLDNSDGRFTPELQYMPNIVQDPSVTGAANSWYPLGAPGFTISANGNAPGETNGKCLQVIATSTYQQVQEPAFSVTPGEQYRIQAYGWVQNTAAGSGSLLATLFFYDGGGNFVGTLGTGATWTLSDGGSGWIQRTQTGTVPAGAVTAAVTSRITAGVTSGAFLLDAVRVQQVNPYYPNVKLFRPIRVTATLPDASTSVRFLGYVTRWPTQWPNGLEEEASSTLTAVSRMARLGTTTKLRSMVSNEILAATPLLYYPLGEAQGSTSAANVSTTSLESLTIRRPGSGTFPYPTTGPNVVFGNATGPAGDGASAVTFDGTGVLAVEYSQFYNNNVSVSAFVQTPAAPASLWSKWLGIFAVGFLWELDFTNSTGHIACIWGGTTLESANGYADGKWHHVAVVLTGGTTATLYVDGVSVASGTVSGDIDLSGIEVGGSTLYFSTAPFVGSIAHVAVLPTALTTQQISDIYTLGMGTLTETTANRATRLAGYGGIPVAETSTSGVVLVGGQDASGKTVLDALRDIEATEAGVLYDARDGTLTLASRSARYSATSAFTLDAHTQIVATDFQPDYDETGLVNDVTATGPSGSARFVNQSSIDDNGQADGSLSTVATNADEPMMLAGWLVNNYSQPRSRVPTLTVDLVALGASATAVAAATVGTLFGLSNMPSQAATSSTSYFAEGYTEHFAADQFGPTWAVTFNVSDATPFLSVWTVEDATLGQYDAYQIAL